MIRRVFRCLERPPTDGLSTQDVWESPVGHSTLFVYSLFGGYWGTWHHLFTSEKGPKEWVFKPFVDEQTMVGEKGRMIYKQHHTPQQAVIGSAWLCPNGSFKRVLSRGGAWENVNPGSIHPDERDHDDEQQQKQRAEAEQSGVEVPEVSAGAGESAPGNGDDGQVPGVPDSEPENTGVESLPETDINPDSLEEIEIEVETQEEPGVDGNGSPVL